MQSMAQDWYKNIWTLEIQDQSWMEETGHQVDFLIQALHLTGGERILDLACGFGRHTLELARRGFQVVGVDITPDYIAFAREQAKREGLSAAFFCMDIREISFEREFDVVLSMADGAIGYLENEEENRKIFELVSKALKPGGKHFMDIMSGTYADTHFPCRLWDAGEKRLTLSCFEWNSETRILLYGQKDYPYGAPLERPAFEEGNPIRLYTLPEIAEIYASVGLRVTEVFGDFAGSPFSPNCIQMLACGEKVESVVQK